MVIDIRELLCGIIVILFLNMCANNKERSDFKTMGQYYDCCNILIRPEKLPFFEKIDKYLFVNYYKGGEFGDYSMTLDFQKIENKYKIITSVKFHTNEFNKKGEENVLYVNDTIHDYLVIGNLIDSLKIHNPLQLSCIKGFDDKHTTNGKIDVYYKEKDSSNCFFVTDTNNTLTDTDYKFFFNIFDNPELFKITLGDLKKKRDFLFDSLTVDAKIDKE